MARKISKGKLTIIRSRSTGFALIGIMGFLIAGFVFQPAISSIPNLLPQTNPDNFQIPFVTPEQMQNNEQILDQIENISLDPEQIVQIDPVLKQEEQSCQQQIITASQGSGSVTNETVAQCNSIEKELEEHTQNQIEGKIEDLNEMIINPPPVTYPNQSSTTDPFTQICDLNPSLIVCSKTSSLELVTKILKIDSSGKQTTVETTKKISQLLSFFVEDTTNIDYRTGSLTFELYVKGDKNFNYKGTGKIDVLVGQQSIFAQPLPITIDGVAGDDGRVRIFISSPSGGLSDIYQFRFTDHFDKFINQQTTDVKLKIIELNVSGDRNQKFQLLETVAFSMGIARDDTRVLITDEQGVVSRVYPSDSRIILNSVSSTSSPYQSYLSRVQTYKSTFLGNGQGCTQFVLISDVSYPPSGNQLTYPVPAPTISGISVLDSQNKLITSSNGGTGKVLDFAQLTRDQNYTLKVNSPSIVSKDLVYGKSQETKTFTCKQTGTPKLTTKITSETAQICSQYNVYTNVIIDPNTPITLGAITCDIPK